MNLTLPRTSYFIKITFGLYPLLVWRIFFLLHNLIWLICAVESIHTKHEAIQIVCNRDVIEGDVI